MKTSSRHSAEVTLALPTGVHVVVIQENRRLRITADSDESPEQAVTRIVRLADAIERATNVDTLTGDGA